MTVSLVTIPGIPDEPGSQWRVRALSLDSKSPALSDLIKWQERENRDYKKIIRSLRYAAQNLIGQCHNIYIKKCHNALYGDVYEARADKLHARLMFFYDLNNKIIICTNSFWKTTSGNKQDTAFRHCDEMRKFYEKSQLPT